MDAESRFRIRRGLAGRTIALVLLAALAACNTVARSEKMAPGASQLASLPAASSLPGAIAAVRLIQRPGAGILETRIQIFMSVGYRLIRKSSGEGIFDQTMETSYQEPATKSDADFDLRGQATPKLQGAVEAAVRENIIELLRRLGKFEA